jgi:hypothetical protein
VHDFSNKWALLTILIPKRLNVVEGIRLKSQQVCSFVDDDDDDDVDLSRAWKTIRENIKISAKGSLGYREPMQHKPWFDKNVQNYCGIFAQSWVIKIDLLCGELPQNMIP